MAGTTGGPLEPRAGRRVLDPCGVVDLLAEPRDQSGVPVVATQLGVALRGDDVEHAVAHVDQRDVERPATEVVDEHRLLVRLVRTNPVREAGSGRLAEQSVDLEPGDLCGPSGRLPLLVAEVRRDRHHGVRHGPVERLLGAGFELREHERGDLFGRVLGILGAGEGGVLAERALDRPDRPLRVRDGLVGRFPADVRPALGERDDGGNDGLSRIDLEDAGRSDAAVGYDAVRRPEVDTDGVSAGHGLLSTRTDWTSLIMARITVQLDALSVRHDYNHRPVPARESLARGRFGPAPARETHWWGVGGGDTREVVGGN